VVFESAEANMEEVKSLGWEQEDVRGANFIRLTGRDNIKRIAMIDFESLCRSE
jgi:predicted chitinase